MKPRIPDTVVVSPYLHQTVSPFLRFEVTEPSRMISVRTDRCHVGLFREFVGTVCCTYGQRIWPLVYVATHIMTNKQLNRLDLFTLFLLCHDVSCRFVAWVSIGNWWIFYLLVCVHVEWGGVGVGAWIGEFTRSGLLLNRRACLSQSYLSWNIQPVIRLEIMPMGRPAPWMVK